MHFASYYRWLVFSFLFAREGFAQNSVKKIVDSRLLDIGCKDASFLQKLPFGCKVGIDYTATYFPKNIEKINLVASDAASLPFKARSFTHVLLNDVIEHVKNDHQVINMIAHVLIPGGKLWISTPSSKYNVGPYFITNRFEQAWGHVRKGYSPDTILQMLSSDFVTHKLVIWPETSFRVMQLPNWLLSRISMGLARQITAICFQNDRKEYISGIHSDSPHGHLYISTNRRSL
jgi:ubiquinone/menaquinone biosynthesis C-methylase UbiE